MTLKEFISRKQAWQASTSKVVVTGTLILFGLIFLISWLEHHLVVLGYPLWLDKVFVCLLMLLSVCVIPLLKRFMTRQFEQFGVMCPKCGKPLVGRNSGILVATGKCGECGAKVLNDANSG
jgi:hypothetical protein